jgi:hypothetical protein
MDTYRLDLKTIAQSLRDVQREFPKINEILHSRRDSMTDEVLENMLAGYAFVDKAVADGADLFTLRHIPDLLEINHIVLCGLNQQVRQEYQTHIEATAQRFYEQEEFNIDDILRWYYKHENEGFDHGVGHPLLLLYDAKAPLGKNSNYFNGLGHDLSNPSISLF